jgi:hypothetical protein
MSDRELLELAAKAAGIAIHRIIDASAERDSPLCVLVWTHDSNMAEWSPLADDGDRYRLAKACSLKIDFARQQVWSDRCYMWPHDGDEAHCILRAAAEMAESGVKNHG